MRGSPAAGLVSDGQNRIPDHCRSQGETSYVFQLPGAGTWAVAPMPSLALRRLCNRQRDRDASWLFPCRLRYRFQSRHIKSPVKKPV